MKKKKKIITAIIVFIGIALSVTGIVLNMINKKFIYNSDNEVGNSACNLYNGGLFCERDGKIYFANPADNNYLYRMNSDCTNPVRLNTDSIAYINADENHLYYVKNNFSPESIGTVLYGHLFGIYRTDLNGKQSKALYNKLSGTASLCGNYIYYQRCDDGTKNCLYRAKIDGSEDTKLAEISYNPACVYNGNVYFSNVAGDHNVLKLSSTGAATSVFYYGNTYMPAIENNILYYIDLSDGYSLKRCSLSDKTLELISDRKCINYNVIGNKVYYVTEGSDGGLYRSNTDGSQTELVSKGNISSIFCTSSYTFFMFFGDETLYRVSSVGSINSIDQIEIK